MKQIIALKKYDTSTAKVVVGPIITLTQDDPRYKNETLYQKENGEYFLVGFGGIGSVYAGAVDNGRTISDPHIFPYTTELAKLWAVSNISCDEFESIFGPVEE